MQFVSNGILIGSLHIHYYGILVLCGFLAGTFAASKAGLLRNFTEDNYWDGLPWIIVGGIAGARLWHVLMPSISSGIGFAYYMKHPAEIFAIWNGGLGIPGGILGGTIGCYLFCRKHHLSAANYIDTISIGLPLGQAIGRWGNFVNQELYGKPSSLPWAITIDPINRISGYEDISTYHPLFLYESIYCIGVFTLLWFLNRDHREQLRPGSISYTYFIAYPLGRFFLEFLRLDRAMIGGINMNQTIMGVVTLCAAVLLIWNQRRPMPVKSVKHKNKKK